ncbi:MAG: hypothetical protein QGG54_05870 [Gammaproteobacteria bacterium]|jgi:hypothetical protein|nr:hypothetical protein [Chromatiales bacterium]MDP6414542.1 hypothetical protein [Gammaproteobacteria bacterium]MDP6673602.1 hypothetical protein [Gammaproteobacteria bacterium]
MTGWITHLLAFLVGAGTVVLLLVNRRNRAGSKSGKVLRKLYRQCPEFFDDVRIELGKAEFQDVREFAILKSSQITFVSEDVRFVYYEDELPNLKEIAAGLEDLGFIDDVTRGKTPLYRMRENFVTALGSL